MRSAQPASPNPRSHSTIEINPNSKVASFDNIYKLEGPLPARQSIFFAIQHIVTMFVGNLTPIFLISGVARYGGASLTAQDQANLVQASILVAGLATLLMVFPRWKIGVRLPLVLGASFVYLGACMILAKQDYSLVIGAVIAGGLVQFGVGMLAPYWIRYISPLVAGLVVLTLGIGILESCITFCAGGQQPDAGNAMHFIVASITLVTCLFAQTKFTGMWKQLNVLFGLIVGYLCSVIITYTGFYQLVDFSVLNQCLTEQGLLTCPKFFPFFPTFNLSGVVVLSIISLTSSVEITGTVDMICSNLFSRPADKREIGGAVSFCGLSNALNGLVFGTLPVAAFKQNVGVLFVSKAINIQIIMASAFLLILAGFMPVVGLLLTTLPSSVLGGCLVMVFGSIVYAGIKMIMEAGLTQRNSLIVSISLCIGLGSSRAYALGFLSSQISELGANVPETARALLMDCPITLVFIISMLLSLLLPKEKPLPTEGNEPKQ